MLMLIGNMEDEAGNQIQIVSAIDENEQHNSSEEESDGLSQDSFLETENMLEDNRDMVNSGNMESFEDDHEVENPIESEAANDENDENDENEHKLEINERDNGYEDGHEDDEKESELVDIMALLLPKSRIKKIVKMDPEVRQCGNEALIAITKATELFVQKLAESSYSICAKDKRKTIREGDLIAGIFHENSFDFLRSDFDRHDATQIRVGSNKKQVKNVHTKSIEDFFSNKIA